MRTLLLALALVAFPGCGLFGPGGVDSAVVTSVRVESLDLSKPWDSPLTNDRPDVYVDIRSSDEPAFTIAPKWRSEVFENLETLPISVRPPDDDAPVYSLDEGASIRVADRDFAGDDQMFTTGLFTFDAYYDGQEAGTVDRLTFETEEGRITVFVEWR